jgi:hypothetical protein
MIKPDKPMFIERYVSYYRCKQKMMSFQGPSSWEKMTSSGGMLQALAHHPTKKVNKAEDLTYPTSNIETVCQTNRATLTRTTRSRDSVANCMTTKR